MEEVDWDCISSAYREAGKILSEKTEETRVNCSDGVGDNRQEHQQRRRLEIIKLRSAAEFLIKSLYIKQGFCIFRVKNEILKISDLDRPVEIDLEKTHDFYYLIEMLGTIGLSENLDKLKTGLHEIRKRGNKAVHKHELDESVITDAKTTIETLLTLTDK